jgi:hypothetical protein
MIQIISFFQSRQKILAIMASLYVIFLLLSHWQLPPKHVWIIAAFFSIIMNFTYVTEAYVRREFLQPEVLIAGLLITLSVLGAISAPIFVIIAIFGHGLWDVAKHLGLGVPFFSWYTLSCCFVDMAYGFTLLIYYIS